MSYGVINISHTQTLEPLPTRQHVAELPDINWKGYMESVGRVVRQHSSVYQRTRGKAPSKEAATLTKMVFASACPHSCLHTLLYDSLYPPSILHFNSPMSQFMHTHRNPVLLLSLRMRVSNLHHTNNPGPQKSRCALLYDVTIHNDFQWDMSALN